MANVRTLDDIRTGQTSNNAIPMPNPNTNSDQPSYVQSMFPPLKQILMPAHYQCYCVASIFATLMIIMFVLEMILSYVESHMVFQDSAENYLLITMVPYQSQYLKLQGLINATGQTKIFQIYRVGAALFFSRSFVSLLIDCSILVVMCTRFELKWGSLRFASFYLLPGLCGYFAGVAFHSKDIIISFLSSDLMVLGAYPCWLGICGAEIAWNLMNFVSGDMMVRNYDLAQYVIYAFILMLQMMGMGTDTGGTVGLVALLSGILLGVAFASEKNGPVSFLDGEFYPKCFGFLFFALFISAFMLAVIPW